MVKVIQNVFCFKIETATEDEIVVVSSSKPDSDPSSAPDIDKSVTDKLPESEATTTALDDEDPTKDSETVEVTFLLTETQKLKNTFGQIKLRQKTQKCFFFKQRQKEKQL